jgi:hypothetical protein
MMLVTVRVGTMNKLQQQITKTTIKHFMVDNEWSGDGDGDSDDGYGS